MKAVIVIVQLEANSFETFSRPILWDCDIFSERKANLSYSSYVFIAVFFAETEIFVETKPNIITIQAKSAFPQL